MRRYELMLVIRPDVAEDRAQAVLDRATRSITGGEGQIVKISPWGRRRLAYPIGLHREGSYHIVLFDAPSAAVLEMERGLNITEEVLRHLVTRVERPASRRSAAEGEPTEGDADMEPPEEAEADLDGEFIDESETEAAPAAIE
ncbi:MAG: 30S ribosomal protein S6 [Chloroflexi bacterium]|jgi:small subunit ribosomal protein S6|nr:30S ribosomal protein S6 [Chloroflexota bacterium]